MRSKITLFLSSAILVSGLSLPAFADKGHGMFERTDADGDGLSNIVEYNTTGTFDACLVAYNRTGCADTLCLPVQTLVEAAVDVPNAFTPLSNDINSVVQVKGYGIGKMKFIIWNRWGQKVFESDNKSTGWNGRVNGVLQPMDVYAYTLEVEFTDGTRVTKKGDITLIR